MRANKRDPLPPGGEVWWNLSQGASHQLFHILIALGQIVFFFGLRKAMLIHYHHHPAINLKVKSA